MNTQKVGGAGPDSPRTPAKPGAQRRVGASSKATPHSSRVRNSWEAEIVEDAKTHRVTLILLFQTVGGERRELRVPAEDRENFKKIRRQLLGYDADFAGPERDDLKLIKELFDTVPKTPLIEVKKPGFTNSGRGFVLGRKLLGDAKGRYWWHAEPDTTTVGEQGGTKEGWDEVGCLLARSSFLSVAVLAVLASPVRRYLELRARPDSPRRPIISETATFNFVGASASGKTLVGEVAASVTGHKNSRSKWDFTRRALEEYLESRNEIGAIFDDREKHIGEHLTIEKAIAIVTQYVPGGSSKEISHTAAAMGLDRKGWDTFALSSSPHPTDNTLKRRTDGQKVRFIDLILPKRERGGDN